MSLNKSIVYKEGLYERVGIPSDIPVPKYRPESYNQKNFIEETADTRVPVFSVEYTNKSISLKNQILRIDDKEYDIHHLQVKDVMYILEDHGVSVSLITEFELFQELPAFLLFPFINKTVTKIDGDISPLNFVNFLYKNNTIQPIEKPIIKDIKAVDLSDNSELKVTVSGDHLFFTPKNSVKLYMTELSEAFYVYATISPIQVTDGHLISNLIYSRSTNTYYPPEDT